MSTQAEASAGTALGLDEIVVSEVRAWMARRRYTQTSFAERLGVKQQWLSRRLSGAVPLTLDDVELLADGLGVSSWVLLRGDLGEGVNSPLIRTVKGSAVPLRKATAPLIGRAA